MNNETMLLIALVGLGLLCVTAYAIYRDRAATAKNITLAKHIKTLEAAKLTHEARIAALGNEITALKSDSVTIIAEQFKLFNDKLRDMQIENDTNAMRVDRLDERLGEYLSITPTSSLDTTRVITLHKSGLTVAEIAKELHANHSEVLFALKMHDLNPRK
ncbi:hypothetical protein AGMMS50229_18990 [Campylobacterota bacterium]|nr:hypothetical protein AGMMS50229_18990 [Campylobacterota bacterium]